MTLSNLLLLRLYVFGVFLALAGSLVGRLGVRDGWLDTGSGVALAVATCAPLLIGAVVFRRLVRRELDELLERVLLEGLAFAFVALLPIVAFGVTLRDAGLLGLRLDATDLLLGPVLLAVLGIVLAWRRRA